jgi:D-3-phosphoglycerate dehydrogenase
LNQPGAIGSIGVLLGKHHINIGQMQVGEEAERDTSIIYIRTDTPIPDEVVEEMRALPLINTVIPLEL